MLPDFDITTNDNGKNVIIQCSLGFYKAVAKPSLPTISSGFRYHCVDATIDCNEKRTTVDQNSSIPGLLLPFLITAGAGDPVPETVHLHHTKSKLQIQASRPMPGHTTAAGWFVENILKRRFLIEAKNKKFAIEIINKKVRDFIGGQKAPETISSSLRCSHCRKDFGHNSRPLNVSNAPNSNTRPNAKGFVEELPHQTTR